MSTVDPRIVTFGVIQEVSSYTFDPQTLATIPVGDHRQIDTLIVGVDPRYVSTRWRIDGHFLSDDATFEAVIGDSVARSLYSPNSTARIDRSDPLLEDLMIQDTSFNIVGTCIDPLNNGFVVYVPLERLANLTGFSSPNIVFVSVDATADTLEVIASIEDSLSKINENLIIVNTDDYSQNNLTFLGSMWQVVMLIPLFFMTAAIFSLVAFCLLSFEEQQQDYAVLRAIGTKPKQVIYMLCTQNLILLFSSFAVGLSLGTIITLLILMREPVVSVFTPITIGFWLFGALLIMSLVSLYPAVKFSQKPLLQLMS